MQEEKVKILIAEDDPVSHRLLLSTLSKWGYEVVACTDGKQAMEELSKPDAPRLIILDWMMPGMDGLEVCEAIRERESLSYTYVLLLTARNLKEDIVAGMEAGADDYLTKPFHAHELRLRLRAGLRIIHLQSQLIQSREEYRRLATNDPLTGVWNRAAIVDCLAGEQVRSERQKVPLSVIMIDVDHFKKINDTYGHMSGDAVLCEAARRLQESMRVYDKIGRYGGEEFLLILPACDLAAAAVVAERLRAQVAEDPIETKQESIQVTCSLGVASNSGHLYLSAERLIRAADEALYHAKEQGRNRAVAMAEAGQAGLDHEDPGSALNQILLNL